MKIQTTLALLTLAVILPNLASAAQPACAFGDSTAALSDIFDQETGQKLFYRGELLSVSNPRRLNGLSPAEKQMIQRVMASGEIRGLDESLDSFSRADGYINYFTHGRNGREFAIVASFPGDNEYGQILEIKLNSRDGTRENLQILGVAAVIADGDLEDCKVFE